MIASPVNRKVRAASSHGVIVLLLAIGIASMAGCGGGVDPQPAAAAPPITAAPPSLPPVSTPPPTSVSSSLGIVELDISGLGTAKMTSEARWDDSTLRRRALNAGVAATSPVPAGLDVQFLAASSEDIASGPNAGMRLLSITYKVRNAQACGTPGTCTAYTLQRNNLTFLAVVTTSSINSSAISRFQLFNGDPANAALATQMLPMHGMTNFGTTVDPLRASMQVYRSAELPAVDPNAIDLLPYGFVVRHASNGSRTLAANPAPNQFDGLVTLAFKLPIQSNSQQNPYRVTMRFQVVEDTNTRVTQSVDESPASAKLRADALNAPDIAVLCNTASPIPNANPICGARIAGTLSNPSSFLATAPVPVGQPKVLLAPVNLLNMDPKPEIVLGTSEAMNLPTVTTLVVHGSQSGMRTLTGAYTGSYSGGTASRPNQLVFKPGPTDKPFFRGEHVTFTATAANTSLVGNAPLTKFVGSFRVAGSASYTGSPTAISLGSGDFTAPMLPICPPPLTLFDPPCPRYQFPPNSLILGNNPTAPALGDLNGDGQLDVVVVNADPAGTVSVLLGNGTGIYAETTGQYQTYPAGAYPNALALGDVNGDGRLDAVVLGGDLTGTVSVLLGDGAGGFGPPIAFPAGGFHRALALGDFNGDGKLDIALAGSGSDGLVVLLGTGSGGFSSPVFQSVGTESGQNLAARAIAIGDVNGDGRLDIVTVNSGVPNLDSLLPYISTVSVLLGQASGSLFAAATTFTIPFDSNAIVMGDVNADGRLDIVVTSFVVPSDPMNPYLYPGAALLLGQSNGTFAAAQPFAFGNLGAASIALADVNGDSRLDLILISNYVGDRKISVYRGTTDGVFDYTPITSPFDIGYVPYGQFALGDLNGDGRLDMVVVDQTAGSRILVGW